MRKTGKNAYSKLYKTAAWDRLRSTLLQDEPWCRFCARKGLKIPADVVDHIKEHKGDLELFHDYANLQPLCFTHHNSTKQKMERGVLIIEYGPDGFPLKPRKG